MSHASGLARVQGVSVAPSGLFPSVRDKPTGSLVAGIWAFIMVLHIWSFAVSDGYAEVRSFCMRDNAIPLRRLVNRRCKRVVGILLIRVATQLPLELLRLRVGDQQLLWAARSASLQRTVLLLLWVWLSPLRWSMPKSNFWWVFVTDLRNICSELHMNNDANRHREVLHLRELYKYAIYYYIIIIWSYRLVPVTTRARVFWTRRNMANFASDTPSRWKLQLGYSEYLYISIYFHLYWYLYFHFDSHLVILNVSGSTSATGFVPF